MPKNALCTSFSAILVTAQSSMSFLCALSTALGVLNKCFGMLAEGRAWLVYKMGLGSGRGRVSVAAVKCEGGGGRVSVAAVKCAGGGVSVAAVKCEGGGGRVSVAAVKCEGGGGRVSVAAVKCEGGGGRVSVAAVKCEERERRVSVAAVKCEAGGGKGLGVCGVRVEVV